VPKWDANVRIGPLVHRRDTLDQAAQCLRQDGKAETGTKSGRARRGKRRRCIVVDVAQRYGPVREVEDHISGATIAAARTAADTGHLVFATLHTNDAAQAVDRCVDAFPADAHAQVRTQLAAVLAGIVGLRLVPRKDAGRRAAAEILVGTDAAKALIREGKTHPLRNTIVTGRAAGMQTLEAHLCDLIVHGEVELRDARAVTNRPDDVRAFERAAS